MTADVQRLKEEVDKAARILGEHCEACVIIASITDGEGCDERYRGGTGSGYARHAMIAEQYLMWREHCRAEARAEAENSDDE